MATTINRFAAAVAPALLLAAAGCGYQVGRLYQVDNISVPIFENDSDRRINEFELTETVVREMQAHGLTVNPRDPRYRLEGRIVKIHQRRFAEDRDSNVIVGSFGVSVEIVVKEEPGGRPLRPPASRQFTAPFSIDRGQTLETARAKVFDEVGKWVMERMEKVW